MVNPRDIAGNTEEEWWTPEIQLRTQKKNGQPQRYSWEHRRRMVNPRDTAGNARRRRRRMVNPRDIAGNTEEEWWTPEIQLRTQKKNGEPQRYSWEHRRRRRMVNPRDTAGNAEEEEEEWWTPEIQLRTQKKNGEPQRYSWEHRRRRMVNPRDTAGNAEEEEEEWWTPEIQLGTQKKKKNGEPQRYSWECRRRRRRMVNPRDTAGNAEEEEEEWWTPEIQLGMQKKKKKNGEPQRQLGTQKKKTKRILVLLLHYQLYLLGSPFLVISLHTWSFFNPTMVVTLRLRGWCIGHKCQDLLSLCDGMHVCTARPLFILSSKIVIGNGVRTHVNSKRHRLVRHWQPSVILCTQNISQKLSCWQNSHSMWVVCLLHLQNVWWYNFTSVQLKGSPLSCLEQLWRPHPQCSLVKKSVLTIHWTQSLLRVAVWSLSMAYTSSLVLHSPAISLGFTILGEIFAYVTVFQSNHWDSHIPSSWILHAGFSLLVLTLPSKTWMSGSFESVWWNACVQRLDLGLYSHLKEFWGMESEPMLTPGENPLYQKMFPQRRIEPAMLHHTGQQAQGTTNELFRSPHGVYNFTTDISSVITEITKSIHPMAECVPQHDFCQKLPSVNLHMKYRITNKILSLTQQNHNVVNISQAWHYPQFSFQLLLVGLTH